MSMSTVILSGIKTVGTQLSYDTLLEKYALQISVGNTLVEFLITGELLDTLAEQIQGLVLDRTQPHITGPGLS